MNLDTSGLPPRAMTTVIAVILISLLGHGQQSPGPATASNAIHVYEDEYVRLTFPAGWDLQPRYEENGDRGVLLTNGAYELRLRYHTSHASGIMGGRPAEALTIPWLNPGVAGVDPSECLARLRATPSRNIGREMRFYSLTLDGSDCDTRVDCSIKTRIGPRWAAGYFSPDGRFFFGPDETRTFTLVYHTIDVRELPIPGDAVTQRVIAEAATIVNSIRYKAPAASAP